MTTTFETPITKPAAEHMTTSEMETAVLRRVDELTDPSGETYAKFYEAPGIVSTELTEARLPFAGHVVLLKDETCHFVEMPDGKPRPVPTFKRRGARAAALFAMQANPEVTRLATASAGNHGQGVAAAALEFGLDCEVHTKETASAVKVESMSALGADVYSRYDKLQSALDAAEARADAETASVPPYDDLDVIAGQATVGVEMLASLLKRKHAGELNLRHAPVNVVLPVGGGGLAAGVAIIFKHAKDQGLIGENVRIVIVEAKQKLQNAWVDGTQTNRGQLPNLILSDPAFVQEHRVVSDLEIANAMHATTSALGKRVEPAGALAYAGAWQAAARAATRDGNPRQTFIVPITGASVTAESYQYATALRNEAYEQCSQTCGSVAVAAAEPGALGERRSRVAAGLKLGWLNSKKPL